MGIPRAAAAALVIGVLGSLLLGVRPGHAEHDPSPADGRCRTSRPHREPTRDAPGGKYWADERSVAHSGPDRDPNFYEHADLEKGAVQGRAQADNSIQYYASTERRCAVVGAWSVGADGPWEFDGTQPVEQPG